MTKDQMIATLDSEIEFEYAKGCGMSQFVGGLVRAKKVLTNQWCHEKEKSYSDGLDYKRDHEKGVNDHD